MIPILSPFKLPLIRGGMVCAGLLVAACLGNRESNSPLRVLSPDNHASNLLPPERVATLKPLEPSKHLEPSRRQQSSEGSMVVTNQQYSAPTAPSPNFQRYEGQQHPSPSANGNKGLASARSSRSQNSLDDSFPTQDELEGMARRAEQRANHELRRLAKSLDLDEGQQDVIFEIVARSSHDFLPVMNIDSDLGEIIEPLLESTETVEEAIEAVLDGEQAARYAEQNEERREWWWTTLRDFIPDEELPEVFEESESYVP